MNKADEEYLKLAKNILDSGKIREDRTGTGTVGLFGPQMEFDLSEGFPLLTTKRVPFRLVAEELLWFIKGDTDLQTLLNKDVNIWNGDGYRYFLEQGGEDSLELFLKDTKKFGFDLGLIYGHQWRSWESWGCERDSVDQLQNVIDSLKDDPYSRRHVVTAWNPRDEGDMALPPCHILFQFYVEEGNKLSCKLYQRSGDHFLGIPFNIASYSLLVHIIAKMLDMEVGRFIHSLGDSHIYLNHREQMEEQISRVPRQLPSINIKTKHKRIEDYTMDDIELIGYDPHDTIKGEVSVGL